MYPVATGWQIVSSVFFRQGLTRFYRAFWARGRCRRGFNLGLPFFNLRWGCRGLQGCRRLYQWGEFGGGGRPVGLYGGPVISAQDSRQDVEAQPQDGSREECDANPRDLGAPQMHPCAFQCLQLGGDLSHRRTLER